MNILSYGARCTTSQIDRIEQGFIFYGHIINEGIPDLIYANDIGHWDEALETYKKNPNSKCILTILDLPIHLEEDCQRQVKYVKEVVEKYPEVIICTISKFCQKTIKKLCDVDTYVIYQPIKDITDLGIPWQKRPIDYLIVGRNHDKGKGHDFTINVIKKMHGDISKLFTVGEGFVGAQNYGNVTDEQLNIIYNNTKFIFSPSKFEGMGLPPIEASIGGCIPIVCNDSPVCNEFWGASSFSRDETEVCNFIKNEEKAKEFLCQIRSKSLDFKSKFSKNKIAKNILNI